MNERATDNDNERLPIKAELENPTPMLAAEIVVSKTDQANVRSFPLMRLISNV
jgi:hypothetical protein